MHDTRDPHLQDCLDQDWADACAAYKRASQPGRTALQRDAARTRLYQLAVIRGAMQPTIVHHHTPVSDEDVLRNLQAMAEAARYDQPGTTPLVGPYGR